MGPTNSLWNGNDSPGTKPEQGQTAWARSPCYPTLLHQDPFISANWRGGNGLAWFTDKLSQYVGANQKWTAVALQTCTGLEREWRGELFSTGRLVLTNSINWGTPGSYSTWINPFLNFTLYSFPQVLLPECPLKYLLGPHPLPTQKGNSENSMFYRECFSMNNFY